MEMSICPGDTAYCVARSAAGSAMYVCAVTVVAFIGGFAVCLPPAYGKFPLEHALGDQIVRTARGEQTDFSVYPESDVYPTEEAAKTAYRKERKYDD